MNPIIVTLRQYIVAWILLCNYEIIIPKVVSFGSGTGGCAGGKAAVGGPHKFRYKKPVTLSLQGSGVIVKAGDVVLSNNTTKTLQLGVEHTVTVERNSFLGILIRLEVPDSSTVETSGALEPGTDEYKLSRRCRSPIVGVTHKDDKEKNIATAKIRFDDPVQGVILDITIVYANNFTTAIHGYDRYLLNF